LKDLNISVVIPNYNGVHLFPETLPALYQSLEYTGKKYEIIIADDCSTDSSLEFIKRNFPEIILLRNEKNSGFSATINKGIFAAKNELVLLLNSDVKLTESYFTEQFRYFELPDTFGVMGKIIGWNDELIQDGAKYPEMQGFKLKTSLNCLVENPKENEFIPSLYLSGANALVRRETLHLLGGFNELYSPFYIEDVDLSVRAWRCGFRCYFEPLAVCRHKTSESIRTKEKKLYIRTIYNRNKFYFHAIHLSGLSFAGWLIQTLPELLFRLLSFRTDYLKSFSELIRNRAQIKQSVTDFDQICQKTGIKLSLKEVRKIIVKSLKNREISFFRN
jgi:GT2 family glycosyltransferase